MNGDGWDSSADAWIAEQGDAGDYGRRFVLDAPMLDRIRRQPFRTALDIGCGEGRFCRLMQANGLRTVGIDPTQTLLDRARQRDPAGDYRLARAETLNMVPGSFDLVVSYLTLIDISDLAAAVAAMVDALRPGGTLLIANLNSFSTAAMPDGWQPGPDGTPIFAIDNYLEERAVWVGWRGIRIQNWHRPLSVYIQALLAAGLTLTHFEEPAPAADAPDRSPAYERVPYFHVMEWLKPIV